MVYLRRAREDDAVRFIAVFITSVLVNGILAILLIEFLHTLCLGATSCAGELSGLVDWRPRSAGAVDGPRDELAFA